MKVQELLDRPSKWAKNTSARDGAGNSVSVRDPNAAAWCLAGAVERCYLGDIDSYPNNDCTQVLDSIRAWLGSFYISDWNDSPERTFEEVRDLIQELDI